MSILIEELKKEHSKILASLNEANEIGLLSREVQAKLLSAKAVQEFFDKYSEGVLDKKFVGEFESLFVALGARIRNEEDVLYDEYEKLNM